MYRFLNTFWLLNLSNFYVLNSNQRFCHNHLLLRVVHRPQPIHQPTQFELGAAVPILLLRHATVCVNASLTPPPKRSRAT